MPSSSSTLLPQPLRWDQLFRLRQTHPLSSNTLPPGESNFVPRYRGRQRLADNVHEALQTVNRRCWFPADFRIGRAGGLFPWDESWPRSSSSLPPEGFLGSTWSDLPGPAQVVKLPWVLVTWWTTPWYPYPGSGLFYRDRYYAILGDRLAPQKYLCAPTLRFSFLGERGHDPVLGAPSRNASAPDIPWVPPLGLVFRRVLYLDYWREHLRHGPQVPFVRAVLEDPLDTATWKVWSDWRQEHLSSPEVEATQGIFQSAIHLPEHLAHPDGFPGVPTLTLASSTSSTS